MTLDQYCLAIVYKYEEIVNNLVKSNQRYSMHVMMKVMALGLWAQREEDYADI